LKAIGGFFEIESRGCADGSYHEGSPSFANGRSALYQILKIKPATKIYLPYFICDSVIEPIARLCMQIEFCSIDSEFEFSNLPVISENEFLLAVNYFGIKGEYISSLCETYGERLIVDNTQAFFRKSEINSFSFNSCRKFFGVPDGSYLYLPPAFDSCIERNSGKNVDFITDHLYLKKNSGDSDEALARYRHNETLQKISEKRMSDISQDVLNHIDYVSVVKRRKENFDFLNESLKEHNIFKVSRGKNDVPFCYPFQGDRIIPFEFFWGKKIFAPMLWPECQTRLVDDHKFIFERKVLKHLIPLPIDHRYSTSEMKILAELIKAELNGK
jgi:hypothetical protein